MDAENQHRKHEIAKDSAQTSAVSFTFVVDALLTDSSLPVISKYVERSPDLGAAQTPILIFVVIDRGAFFCSP